jgi:hypothetical protein
MSQHEWEFLRSPRDLRTIISKNVVIWIQDALRWRKTANGLQQGSGYMFWNIPALPHTPCQLRGNRTASEEVWGRQMDTQARLTPLVLPSPHRLTELLRMKASQRLICSPYTSDVTATFRKTCWKSMPSIMEWSWFQHPDATWVCQTPTHRKFILLLLHAPVTVAKPHPTWF